jgi:hypothetical protein
VFHVSPTDVEKHILHPDHPTRHIHHKANSIGSGHAAEDHAFLEAVARSVADAGAILITGPANEKTELVKHIHRPGGDGTTHGSAQAFDSPSTNFLQCCRQDRRVT